MPAEAVFEHLLALMHAIPAQLREAAAKESPDFPPMAARALNYFSRHPGSTPSDLVEHSGRDKAQIARLVRFLEDEKYVTRQADPDDRRSYTLHLTDRGRSLQKKMDAHRKRLVAQLTSGLSPKETEALDTLLARLRANLGS